MMHTFVIVLESEGNTENGQQAFVELPSKLLFLHGLPFQWTIIGGDDSHCFITMDGVDLDRHFFLVRRRVRHMLVLDNLLGLVYGRHDDGPSLW